MSEVTLAIGGRSYKVACADGEEAHVTRLGAAIDAKLQSMPQLSGQDSQNLLFGALLLADELHEAHAGGGAPAASGPSLEVAQGLEAMASRLEDLAQSLEAGD